MAIHVDYDAWIWICPQCNFANSFADQDCQGDGCAVSLEQGFFQRINAVAQKRAKEKARSRMKLVLVAIDRLLFIMSFVMPFITPPPLNLVAAGWCFIRTVIFIKRRK